jgi:hypothetical protein
MTVCVTATDAVSYSSLAMLAAEQIDAISHLTHHHLLACCLAAPVTSQTGAPSSPDTGAAQ